MSITTLITKLGEILREIGCVAAASELGLDHVPCAASPCRESRKNRPGAAPDACARNA